MTKKKLLKRIEALEKQLADSGLGYFHYINTDDGKEIKSISLYNHENYKQDINEKLNAITDSLGKKFVYKHIPAKTFALTDIENKKKK